MGRNSQGKRVSFYYYTVACVGLFDTAYATIRMRANNLHDSAKRIARQMQPGRVAYNVQSVESHDD